MKRNELDRAPITIEARKATDSGVAASSSSSTASRLARCWEVGAPSGTSPPRYTIRRTPAAAAAEAKFSAPRRSRVSKDPSEEGSIEWMR